MNELVHFESCELNYELVHVENELSQHWPSVAPALTGHTTLQPVPDTLSQRVGWARPLGFSLA